MYTYLALLPDGQNNFSLESELPIHTGEAIHYGGKRYIVELIVHKDEYVGPTAALYRTVEPTMLYLKSNR